MYIKWMNIIVLSITSRTISWIKQTKFKWTNNKNSVFNIFMVNTIISNVFIINIRDQF